MYVGDCVDTTHLRLNGHRAVALGAGRRIVDSRHLSVNIAIELVVQIEVALILQRRAARGALEAVHVQVLVLDAHEHTAEDHTSHADDDTKRANVVVRIVDT